MKYSDLELTVIQELHQVVEDLDIEDQELILGYAIDELSERPTLEE